MNERLDPLLAALVALAESADRNLRTERERRKLRIVGQAKRRSETRWTGT